MNTKNRLKKVVAKVISISIMLPLTTGLVACRAKTQVEDTQPKPTIEQKEIVTVYHNIEDNKYTISSLNKVLTKDQDYDAERNINIYLDPGTIESVKLYKILTESGAFDYAKGLGYSFTFHHIAGSNQKSIDKYPMRAAAYLLGAVEFAPHLWENLTALIYNEDTLPKPNERRSDRKIKELFLKAGGTIKRWNLIVDNLDRIESNIEDQTVNYFNDVNIIKKVTPKVEPPVPLVIIGKMDRAIDFSQAIDVGKHFCEVLKDYNTSISTRKKPLSVEGLVDSYVIGEKLELHAVSDTKFAHARWALVDSDISFENMENLLKEDQEDIDENMIKETVKESLPVSSEEDGKPKEEKAIGGHKKHIKKLKTDGNGEHLSYVLEKEDDGKILVLQTFSDKWEQLETLQTRIKVKPLEQKKN